MIDFESVLECHFADISQIAIRLDGSKAPTESWKEFQERMPRFAELESSFKGLEIGVGIVCGKVSDNLEVLDFDERPDETFAAFRDRPGVDMILCKLPIVETPSGGRHVFLRCHTIAGNQKLAMTKDNQVLIETRGEGGYVVGPLSPEGIHKDGMYMQVEGPPLPAIPMLTPFERGILLDAARSLCELPPPPPKKEYKTPSTPSEDTPWDDFDLRCDWDKLLTQNGWSSRDNVHWSHPTATSSFSAKLNPVKNGSGCRVLTVFSSSTPMEAMKSHSAFSVFRYLECNGDASEAAKKLLKLGYGKHLANGY